MDVEYQSWDPISKSTCSEERSSSLCGFLDGKGVSYKTISCAPFFLQTFAICWCVFWFQTFCENDFAMHEWRHWGCVGAMSCAISLSGTIHTEMTWWHVHTTICVPWQQRQCGSLPGLAHKMAKNTWRSQRVRNQKLYGKCPQDMRLATGWNYGGNSKTKTTYRWILKASRHLIGSGLCICRSLGRFQARRQKTVGYWRGASTPLGPPLGSISWMHFLIGRSVQHWQLRLCMLLLQWPRHWGYCNLACLRNLWPTTCQHDPTWLFGYDGEVEQSSRNIATNQCVIISGAGDLRHFSQFPLRSLVLNQRWRIKTSRLGRW